MPKYYRIVLEIKLQILKNSETTRFLSDCLPACLPACLPINPPPACLPACLPAIRPDCVRCMAPEFSHNKGNHFGFTKLLFW